MYWSLAVAWMMVIFFFSSIKGSGNHSYDLFYFLERKSFHVIEYFILAVLFFLSFSQSRPITKALVFSAALSFFYAISDEWHQTFVFGREGTIRDVAIDLIGIALAVIFIIKFKNGKRRTKN